MSHLPQLSPRAYRSWDCYQDSGTWEVMLFIIISAQRAILPQGTLDDVWAHLCLSHWGCSWHRVGWGQGYCSILHSTQEVPSHRERPGSNVSSTKGKTLKLEAGSWGCWLLALLRSWGS